MMALEYVKLILPECIKKIVMQGLIVDIDDKETKDFSRKTLDGFEFSPEFNHAGVYTIGV